MLFGLLSLLMGHWTLFVAKICVKTSFFSSRFYPCVLESDIRPLEHIIISDSNYFNGSTFPDELTTRHNYCPKVISYIHTYHIGNALKLVKLLICYYFSRFLLFEFLDSIAVNRMELIAPGVVIEILTLNKGAFLITYDWVVLVKWYNFGSSVYWWVRKAPESNNWWSGVLTLEVSCQKCNCFGLSWHF